MKITRLFLSVILCLNFFHAHAQNSGSSQRDTRFKKHVITNDFVAEGATVGDFNNDGLTDIISGAYWFQAPDWSRHEIAKGKIFAPGTEYSNTFLNFSLDVNQDGWLDLIRVGLPGEEAVWYENNKNKEGYWPMHFIAKNLGNESPLFVDIDNDGRPDLLGNDPVAKEVVWLKPPSKKGDTAWTRYVIDSGDIGTHRYTHGLGWTDMNNDGRPDVVITKGWWETPADPKQTKWIFHPANLGEDCSQIYALPIKGKKEPDLVSASAHNYGIWWHERINGKDSITWKHHVIFNGFSQSHGLAMVDINGDKNPDLVTGKRYFAHNGKDPGAFEPAVLYWFEYKPGKTPTWIPHVIDDNSGVGLQVTAVDMNKDGLVDIVVGNKKGVFYFEQVR